MDSLYANEADNDKHGDLLPGINGGNEYIILLTLPSSMAESRHPVVNDRTIGILLLD